MAFGSPPGPLDSLSPSGPRTQEVGLTSQGSAHGRFTRAIKTRNLLGAEMAMRETGTVSLLDALDYLVLLAELRPEGLERAAVRWHGRLETEAATLTLTESQYALGALAMLRDGHREVVDVLRSLLRKVRPTSLPRVG